MNACSCSQSAGQALPKGQCDVLRRVVVVYPKVSLCFHLQVKQTMRRYLLVVFSFHEEEERINSVRTRERSVLLLLLLLLLFGRAHLRQACGLERERQKNSRTFLCRRYLFSRRQTSLSFSFPRKQHDLRLHSLRDPLHSC